MFNVLKINFINDENRTNNYSFVGLQKNNKEDTIDFYLPFGFNNFNQESFEDTKTLFLDLYKIFKQFSTKITKDRDGNINEKGGFEFQTIEDETVLLYSKINMFDTILDEFDDMDIYSFHIKRTNSDKIDYSKIDKHIDKAIFLENNIIYLDEVEINKNTLHLDEAELVEMFSYIYLDIKKALQEEDIAPHIVFLASKFKEKYLTYNSSLFEESSFEITKEILKDRLEIIDRESLLKDAIYDKFYEAIYIFLYGNPFFEGDNDIYWGIDNFAFIWEEMAQYYFFDKYKKDILFSDTDNFEKTNIGGNLCYKKNNFKYPFILKYKEKSKYLYPDLVIGKIEDLSGMNVNTKDYIEKYKNNLNISLIVENIEKKNLLPYSKYSQLKIKVKDTDAGYICRDINSKLNLNMNASWDILTFETQTDRDYFYSNLTKIIIQFLNLFVKQIVDFKYISIEMLKETTTKIKNDIKKQLVYKLALSPIDKINNVFYIPSSSQETNHVAIDNLDKSNIKVAYLNFNDAKKSYLEYKNDK